jgi:uncharacterized protein (UPF0335 family)
MGDKHKIPMLGHNGGPDFEDDEFDPDFDDPQDIGGVAGQRLRAFIERIERLEEEIAALREDVKEIYAEAKGVGFEAKIMRKIIALRKIDIEKRREMDDLLELYKSAIGMV